VSFLFKSPLLRGYRGIKKAKILEKIPGDSAPLRFAPLIRGLLKRKNKKYLTR
jgi:hypothetical protein